MKIVRSILGILTASLVAPAAWANYNSVATTSVVSMQAPKKEGRIWSGFFNASRSTSLVDFQDGSRRDGADYLLRLNFKLNSDFSVRLQGGYSQDLNYPETNDFTDTSLSVVRSPMAGKYIMLGYRGAASIPTSKDSHKRQSLKTSLSTGLLGMINPDRLIPGLDINGALNVGRNIHEYETALDGRVNTQYSSSQTLGISYSFKYGLSVSAEFLHRNIWSYQNVMRDSFEMSQELGWQMNSFLSVAIGHTNSGSTLKANAMDSNVQILDENTSLLYGSLTATF